METSRKKFSDGEKNYSDKKEFKGKRNYSGDRNGAGRKPYGAKRSFSDKSGEGEEKKTYGRKKSYGDRKPYSDRSNGEGAEFKKSYEKRDFREEGSAERKPFRKPYSYNDGDRKFSGERRGYGVKKDFGERKSFGEKRDFGERKSFGEKREFGERKSFGEKRDFGERRSFGAKRDFGARKSFGERKEFVEKKSFGDDNKPETKKKPITVLDERTEIALQTLIDIEKNGKYINLAFKHNEKLDRLDKKDRAYVMRILYGVTEKSYTIDWLLRKVLEERRIKPWLKAILRIGTYLIYYMRTEDETAVQLSVELCKKYVSEDIAPFVKAVLSKLSEKKDEYNPELYKFKDTAERLSVVYSYPQWLIDMWTRDFGQETVMTLLDNESERAINLRVSKASDRLAVMAGLDEAGIRYSEGPLYNTITISDTVNIESLDCYKNGEVTAQGIGSMLTVDCLDVMRNSKVLDCCAAPGGKTFYIAEKTAEEVLSCDVHEHRVELINKGLERLHLENVKTECCDMTEKKDELVEMFDRVLIDAPCSGLGMINSKPDIKNNITEEAINDLADVQAKLLDTVSAYLKKGGTMIYSTCTVSKKENTDNVNKFLSEHPDFELVDVSDKLPDNINYINDGKTILILPSKYNSDAFFISVMHRN